MKRKLLLIGEEVNLYKYINDKRSLGNKNTQIDKFRLNAIEDYEDINSQDIGAYSENLIGVQYDEIFIEAHGLVDDKTKRLEIGGFSEDIDVLNLIKVLKQNHNPKKIFLGCCFSAWLIKHLKDHPEDRKVLKGLEIVCVGNFGYEVFSFKEEEVALELIQNSDADLGILSLKSGMTIKSAKIDQGRNINEEEIHKYHKYPIVLEYLICKISADQQDKKRMKEIENEIKKLKKTNQINENSHKSLLKAYEEINKIDENLISQDVIKDAIINGLLEAVLLNNFNNTKKYLALSKKLNIDLNNESGFDKKNDYDQGCNLNFLLTSLAYKNENIEMMRLLFRNGVDPNAKDDREKTMLMMAAQDGKMNILNELLSNKNVDVNLKNVDGKSAIIYAAHEHHRHAMKALLNAKSDVNVIDDNDNSPLSLALDIEDLEIAELMLQRNIDPKIINTANENLETPLLIAISGDQATIIPKLLQAGADINLKEECSERKTPLMVAIEKGKTQIAQILLKAGADINLEDKNKKTALIHALEKGELEVAKTISEMMIKNSDFKIKRIKEALMVTEEIRQTIKDKTKYKSANQNLDEIEKNLQHCLKNYYAKQKEQPKEDSQTPGRSFKPNVHSKLRTKLLDKGL